MDEQEQSCGLFEGVKGTVEHMVVVCDRYEERRQLVEGITEIIGEEEWSKKLKEW